jgi:hypothetical protein
MTESRKPPRKDRCLLRAILWVVGGVLRLVIALLDHGR